MHMKDIDDKVVESFERYIKDLKQMFEAGITREQI